MREAEWQACRDALTAAKQSPVWLSPVIGCALLAWGAWLSWWEIRQRARQLLFVQWEPLDRRFRELRALRPPAGHIEASEAILRQIKRRLGEHAGGAGESASEVLMGVRGDLDALEQPDLDDVTRALAAVNDAAIMLDTDRELLDRFKVYRGEDFCQLYRELTDGRYTLPHLGGRSDDLVNDQAHRLARRLGCKSASTSSSG